MKERPEAMNAARIFVNKFFPDCQGALLSGSVVRGEATKTSDLDIVIFDDKISSSYRESSYEYGWAIEVFVHNFSSYKEFFDSDIERARPSMPRMVSEGVVLKEDRRIEALKQEAIQILDEGPKPWTEEDIRLKRYFLTDTLDDFIGSADRAEGIFIAQALSEQTAEFVLRTNRQWAGSSKWWVRALLQFDKELTQRLIGAFDHYYRMNEKEEVIEMVDEVLHPYGG
ncbi:nucleotidyltransferase domain-containing protein, partial [Halobacillus sp. BBL2006]|uniref:nucleotidyltransferase domain-containing protein n=1 Tax=Halobacillus sp. BBL2006 TaxID=1543706 RepID=UPI0005426853